MDTPTQALLGAAAAHAVFAPKLSRTALLIGLGAGALADADVLVSAAVDLDLPHTYHRHFSHSLAFVPVGGALASAPFLPAPRLREHRAAVFGAATLAYATHPLLDACTSYGTHLLWPFTSARTAWDCLPIIDPLFTGALLIGVFAGLIGRGRKWTRLALIFCIAYALLGVVQRERAADRQRELMESRGHASDERRVLPLPLSLVMWRSIYRHGGLVHADALRVPPLGETLVRTGGTFRAVSRSDLEPADERLAPLLDDFTLFTDGWMGYVPDRPQLVADLRLARLDPMHVLWGIRPTPGAARPLDWESGLYAFPEDAFGRLARGIFEGEGFEPIVR